MTQVIACQKCGLPIDRIKRDIELITYHKDCWVKFQQETIAIARGKKWHKLEGSETTEYYEE